MATLIIGALFVVALAALIGAFVLIRSDGSRNNVETPKVAPTQTTMAQDMSRATGLEPVPPTTVPDNAVTSQQQRPLSISEMSPRPAQNEEEQSLRVPLNGQFHELVDGLHTVRQQSIEMEQRLTSLNQMVDTIEREQEGRPGIEEE